ncbi:hypothetical protein [Kribbella sp. NBC_00359]|uniref:hypothetical protein n=1 Tax=Kribbella sp. NBC_00359 TaxID=2975966 RepID=UPI002E1B5F60
MIITAASFPTPDLIKKTSNPAFWDQQGRFAEFQAAAANQSLEWLGPQLDAATSPIDRAAAFVQLYRNLAEWRFQLAHRDEGRSPNSELEQYRTPIAANQSMVDKFGRGLRSEGGRVNTETGVITSGITTPASRLSARLATIIEARFAAEAPTSDVLQNRVKVPSGEIIAGNQLIRGGLAASASGFERPIDGFYCTVTGEQRDRHALQREAFSILADLEGERAAGRTDLFADRSKRLAFVEAQYFLYQGPEYERGGDATIRTLLVASHARVFGEALRLPQDIDVMAYAAGQQAFYEHVGRTQSIVTGASTPVATGAAAVRTQDRTTGLERG